MPKKDSGFSMLELLLVMLVLVIIIAIALPQALTAVKGYRLHSDAAAVASQLNVARFRATSQYTPYSLSIDVANSQFSMQRLCGPTLSSVDSNCTGSAYLPRSTTQPDSITLPLATQDSFTTTNPGGTTYPGTITGGSASTTFYFNTRGMPVDSSGNPVSNGGSVIYLKNTNNLTDAAVVSVGGRITLYNWSPSTTTWVAR